jgi:outer membrane biogenesis lipoprotein LolB
MKWRNKAHLSVACLLLLFACGPKKPLVQSPDISEGAADQTGLLSTHAFRPNELKVEARAILQETDTRTEFNLEIRLRHDSLVWMQLSDPFLGFPLMRAVISAERFAMVNRLEGTYFEGDARGLQRLLGMSLPFQLLQAVLLGNFPTDVRYSSSTGRHDGKACLIPSTSPLQDGGSIHDICYFWEIGRPFTYHLKAAGYQEEAFVQYGWYAQYNGFHYPTEIRLEVRGKQPVRLGLSIKNVEQGPLNFPFKIPSSYKLIE